MVLDEVVPKAVRGLMCLPRWIIRKIKVRSGGVACRADKANHLALLYCGSVAGFDCKPAQVQIL